MLSVLVLGLVPVLAGIEEGERERLRLRLKRAMKEGLFPGTRSAVELPWARPLSPISLQTRRIFL